MLAPAKLGRCASELCESRAPTVVATTMTPVMYVLDRFKIVLYRKRLAAPSWPSRPAIHDGCDMWPAGRTERGRANRGKKSGVSGEICNTEVAGRPAVAAARSTRKLVQAERHRAKPEGSAAVHLSLIHI